jgi:hypothetical protein
LIWPCNDPTNGSTPNSLRSSIRHDLDTIRRES